MIASTFNRTLQNTESKFYEKEYLAQHYGCVVMSKMLGENEFVFHFWQNSKQYIYKSNARALESLDIKIYYPNLNTE
jgi:hypothetical protein